MKQPKLKNEHPILQIAATAPAKRESVRINYYQWVPFFLIGAAGAFQLPYMFWLVYGESSGIRLHSLIAEAADKKNLDPKVSDWA